MPRTRDLLLVGIAIAFLLLAIGGTVAVRISSAVPNDSASLALTEPPADFTATVDTKETPSRAERLAAMRKKVAEEFQESAIAAPATEVAATAEELDVTEASSSAEAAESTEQTVVTCGETTTYSGAWQPQNITFAVTEGVRIVTRELTTATASSAVVTLLQLPLRTFPDAKPGCIASDVIGIAQDGSLIRNDEIGLYGIFGADTVVGYALDGFPIYGMANIPTDTCGGAVVNGQYGYYLSADRPTVLGCFAAPPVSLP